MRCIEDGARSAVIVDVNSLLLRGNRNNGQIDMRINAQTILRIYAQIIFNLKNNSDRGVSCNPCVWEAS